MDAKTERIVFLRYENAWAKFGNLYPQIVKTPKPLLTFSKRMTKTAGFCFVEQGEIRLASRFLDQHLDEMLRVTLPHEIAHYVDFLLHGIPENNRWHGPKWQKIMLQYGLNPERCHYMELK